MEGQSFEVTPRTDTSRDTREARDRELRSEGDDRGLHLDEARLRELSTGQLIRHAIAEARLLARAEILHAKGELKGELARAKVAGILMGAAGVLALSALSVLFVAIAAALGLPHAVGAVIVGVVLLVSAGALGYLGMKRLPKKPMSRTQDRLKEDLHLTREHLT